MNEKSVNKDFENIDMVAELANENFKSIDKNKKLTKEDFKNINTIGKLAVFWLVLEIVLLALGG